MKLDEVMNQLLNYIEEHLDETLTVSDLASRAGYSEYHFARVFKSHMGVTTMEYVCGRRLIKASEDILSGEKIIDVAMKYDWKSHSGFTKAFTKEFGFSPSFLRAMRVSIDNIGGNAMNHVFLESTKVGMNKEELYEILQNKMTINRVAVEEAKLAGIYKSSSAAFEGVKRYSGEEYVTHLLNVAIILAELGAGANAILASLFSDVNKKGVKSIEELSSELPKEVYNIAYDVNSKGNELADAKDEVVLIKLAERLHNMRTIEYIDDSKKQVKAKETLEIFMPLARKLNNKKFIDELNDLCMKYV